MIPHGTAWGNYVPQGGSWDKQLTDAHFDADLQQLIEVYSGHGASEVYRDWRSAVPAADGSFDCPEPTPDYLPMCWQAGEIIRGRCLEAGETQQECESRAIEARKIAVSNHAQPHMVVGGSDPREWLDAGQCRDCFQPAFTLRPLETAQYMLARGNFDGEEPRHMRIGFIGSSDNHTARSGSGYKEMGRRGMTDSFTTADGSGSISPVRGKPIPPLDRAQPWSGPRGIAGAEIERFSSYMYTGGLIAVHANGRDRQSIWAAVKEKQVYATSGPRILLWFDLKDEIGQLSAPMGSTVALGSTPRFEVRAVGSFEQTAGCPDSGLSEENIERICMGECYNPSNTRRQITRLEVVRVRPQQTPDEDIGSLIDDPWKTFDCVSNPAGCTAAFEDPEYAALVSCPRDSMN